MYGLNYSVIVIQNSVIIGFSVPVCFNIIQLNQVHMFQNRLVSNKSC